MNLAPQIGFSVGKALAWLLLDTIRIPNSMLPLGLIRLGR